MGFARRLVRKSVRKATPRSIRKAMHPVRTARNAVTPRPVKQLSRAVYTVTNPLAAAENALIGAALYPGRGSSRARSTSRQPPPGMTASEVRAREGAASHDHLARLVSVQRARFAAATRPVVPAPGLVDPAPLFHEEWLARRREVKPWFRARRAALRAEITARASARAAEHYARQLDQHADAQSRADEWWSALTAGQPEVVNAALVAAFDDNPAPVTVVKVDGNRAELVLWLPGLGVLPERRPHVTPGGKLSSKAWGRKDLNDVYAELLGAHTLATLRETWAGAPSLAVVRLAGVVDKGAIEVLFDLTVRREEARWDDDSLAIHLLDDHLRRVGRTGEVASRPDLGRDLLPVLTSARPMIF